MNRSGSSDVRPSPIAGSWYSRDPAKLRAEIEGYLREVAPLTPEGKVISLIVPHAGHLYSGLTAMSAFQAIRDLHFTRVVIVAPSHHPYSAPLLTSGHTAYATPLGEVPVDHEALHSLGLPLSPVRNDREHSLEIELPFLQVLLPRGFSLLPVLVVDQSESLMADLGAALARWTRSLPEAEPALLVASSDLSHFHRQAVANRLDSRVVAALEAMDASQLYTTAHSGEGEACGLGPMAAVLAASQLMGADHATITDYRTSAAVTGDSSSVVGYVSAVLSQAG